MCNVMTWEFALDSMIHSFPLVPTRLVRLKYSYDSIDSTTLAVSGGAQRPIDPHPIAKKSIVECFAPF